jgi:hypothetical protein
MRQCTSRHRRTKRGADVAKAFPRAANMSRAMNEHDVQHDVKGDRQQVSDNARQEDFLSLQRRPQQVESQTAAYEGGRTWK